ncbi:MAG: lipid IV(A) 3-deoxy-D-manno-octulosonic acid transferase [Candidatus Competibacterales bacterium]|nr:lipid IV(A) 3-deoxy-D-manno-octulosonic acid transferase [Candidatus Competibacterales bacterium]
MRLLYTLLYYLLVPAILLRLWLRGRRAPDYRQRWGERLGYCPPVPGGCLWVHAVSLGETRAALPLVRALRERYPQRPLLITTMTPTGSQQVRAALGDSVHHCYLPYDLPGAVMRFLYRTRPQIGVVMETELWPNLFHACASAGIPLVLANARLSERSARGYARIGPLTRRTLDCLTLIAAQSEADAARFRRFGVSDARLRVTGNLKYDLNLPSGLERQGRELRRELFGMRPVWIAASTHAGEDEQVLAAFAGLRTEFPDLVLLLVPRHPERFTDVATLCREQGWRVVRRSAQRPCEPRDDVFLGDSMGELLLFYAAADVAFVGGSLVPTGGHNVIEPALLGVPVVFGPHMFNFTEAGQYLLRAGAAWQVDAAPALSRTTGRLLRDAILRREAGSRARRAVAANSGALARLFECVETLLEPAASGNPPPQLPTGPVKRPS